ncbi:MAG: exodeoxyribonuclease VII small subunit [Prevotella sp.]|nr:exodeoxyribonuclease VII small subunit [Candidatus Prevotella equi]
MKQINYEDAMQKLEDIVQRMENGELDIDSLSKELKNAKELIALCRDKLTKTDEEIKKILNPEK